MDIFCGAGGLSLGWKQAAPNDVELVAAVDSDEALTEVFSANHPASCFVCYNFRKPGDSIEMSRLCRRLHLRPGEIDVLLAGPPCQPFSAAGKRRADDEGMLVYHVCDLTSVLRPRMVLIENVPEFSRVQDGRLLGRVRVAFRNAGYRTDVRILRADSYGVPQMRARCFVLAIRSDVGAPARPLADLVQARHQMFIADSKNGRGQISFYEALPSAITVREAIGDLPSLNSGEGQDLAQLVTPPDSEYQITLRDSAGMLFNHIAVSHSEPLVTALRQLSVGETPQRYESHPLRRKDYFRAAYARLDPNKPAPTITTQTHNPGSGRFTHYRDDRVITVREAARLQSFPDSFRFFGTQESQRRHVGNAVPPLLARVIAESLIPLLS